eukprot:c7444_g1_i2.p1 GENE.c7444_g1_i2~~c7444_g1_i2.p1  ORF type:complete len:319 (-),score=89.81 c7444_g1_i2:48-1004(-)
MVLAIDLGGESFKTTFHSEGLRQILYNRNSDNTKTEQAIEQAFRAFTIEPNETKLILIAPPTATTTANDVQIAFEKFGCSAVATSNHAEASIANYGLLDGVVVGSGHSLTYSARVANGQLIPESLQHSAHAGAAIDAILSASLSKSNTRYKPPLPQSVVSQIKHSHSRIALDWDLEQTTSQLTSHLNLSVPTTIGKLSVSHLLQISCAETFFQPSMIPDTNVTTNASLQEMAFHSLALDDSSNTAHIVLDGGSMMFPGITERLTKEVRKLCAKSHPECSVSVLTTKDGARCVLDGASVLARNPHIWIDRQRYFENGSR